MTDHLSLCGRLMCFFGGLRKVHRIPGVCDCAIQPFNYPDCYLPSPTSPVSFTHPPWHRLWSCPRKHSSIQLEIRHQLVSLKIWRPRWTPTFYSSLAATQGAFCTQYILKSRRVSIWPLSCIEQYLRTFLAVERRLDFTCCDWEPAVLGNSPAPLPHFLLDGSICFQLEISCYSL